MKLGMLFASSLAAIALFSMGCTVTSTESEAAKTGPVAAVPLKGSVEGKEFVGTFARARKGFDEGEMSIDIFETEVGCDSFADTPDRQILFSVPWKAGTTREFKLGSGDDSQTATFVVKKEGKTSNIISVQGRVEIIDAPTEKGAQGKLRLRAVAQGNNVEGEVAVEVCE